MKVLFFLLTVLFFGVGLLGLISGLTNGYIITPIISAILMVIFPLSIYLDWNFFSKAYEFKNKKDSE